MCGGLELGNYNSQFQLCITEKKQISSDKQFYVCTACHGLCGHVAVATLQQKLSFFEGHTHTHTSAAIKFRIMLILFF